MKPRTCDCSKPISAVGPGGITLYYPRFVVSGGEEIEIEEIPDLSNGFLEWDCKLNIIFYKKRHYKKRI